MDRKSSSKSSWSYKTSYNYIFGQGGVLQNKYFPIRAHWEMFADTYTQPQQVPLEEFGKEQAPP